MTIKPIKKNTVEDLMEHAKKDLANEATAELVVAVKDKLKQRRAAAKIVQNIDREVEELKLKIAQELESL